MTRRSGIASGVAGVVVALGVAAAIVLLARSPRPTEAAPAPRFIEETAQSGVVHEYDGDWTFYVGGGVASFDCNDDQFPDLFIAGGENETSLYVNTSSAGGHLTFADATTEATALNRATGAYPIDIDSDNNIDLVVLRNGENVMLRGLGNCSFERANEAWGFDGGDAWSTAFSATWEGDTDLPTLAFGNYVLLDERGFQNGDCYDNVLIRPQNAGYSHEFALSPGWCTLSMLFSDWGRTGQRDLRVSNDRHYYRDGEEQLWRILPNEVPRLYSKEDGWNSLQIWGMGIATYDTTGDGYPEIFLTSQADNKLQSLAGDATAPSYKDIAIRSGVTAHRPHVGGDILPSTAWHPEFRDVNNDGFVDLFISKGNVDEDPGFASRDPNSLLIGQPDGTFVESAEAAGLVHFAKTRGAAVIDLNLDGFLDLVEVNREENVKVWRNEGDGGGHWVSVSLSQDGHNLDSIGAWVEVRVGDHLMEREVTIGGGHVSGQLGPIHFGLGPSVRADVRVTWPDGSSTEWLPLNADRFVTVEKGKDAVVEWLP